MSQSGVQVAGGSDPSDGQSFLQRLGFGLSEGELSQIDRQVAELGRQLQGPITGFAKLLKIEEALVVPLAITGTGLAIAGVGIFAVATAPVSVPAALFLGGALGLIGGSVTAVGLDLGATQINETFGTSLPSTGLLPPIRRGRLRGP